MPDNAGYRPTDDSALRWEDCHCANCGERDKECTCKPTRPTERERIEMCGPDPVRNSDLGI